MIANDDEDMINKLKSQLVAMRTPRRTIQDGGKKTTRSGSSPLEQCVLLDVGGTLYSASKAVLTAVDGTYFTLVYSGVLEPVITSDGHMFIDRDGKAFRWVIAYLRSVHYHEKGTLLPDTRSELMAVKCEAHFYQLTQLEEEADASLKALAVATVPHAPAPAPAEAPVSGTVALKAAANQLEFESVYVTISNRNGPDFDPQACTMAMDNVNAKTEALQAKGFRVKAMNTGVAQDRKSKDYIMYYHVVLVRDMGVSVPSGTEREKHGLRSGQQTHRLRQASDATLESTQSSVAVASSRPPIPEVHRSKAGVVQVATRKHSRMPELHHMHPTPSDAATESGPLKGDYKDGASEPFSPASARAASSKFGGQADSAIRNPIYAETTSASQTLDRSMKNVPAPTAEKVEPSPPAPPPSKPATTKPSKSKSSQAPVSSQRTSSSRTQESAAAPRTYVQDRAKSIDAPMGPSSLRSNGTTIDTMHFDGSSASLAFETAHAQAVENIQPYNITPRVNTILGITDSQEEQRIIDINTPWEEPRTPVARVQSANGIIAPKPRVVENNMRRVSESNLREDPEAHGGSTNTTPLVCFSEMLPANSSAPASHSGGSGSAPSSSLEGPLKGKASSRSLAGKWSRALFTKTSKQ